MDNSIATLKKAYPWPNATLEAFKPFYWSLDAGGKELIKQLLKEKDIKVMVEVGVFLGGSCIQWLASKEDLIVIGIDPWNFKAHEYFDKNIAKYKEGIHYNFYDATQSEISEQLKLENGFFYSTLKNLQQYKERFIPVQDSSPGALIKLSDLGIKVDLVYLDGNKSLEEVEIIRQLFPQAIICGDDWTWKNAKGEIPVQKIVHQICKKYNLHVRVNRVSWVIEKNTGLKRIIGWWHQLTSSF